MAANIGRLDQVIRIGISGVLIYIGFIDQSLIQDTLSSNIVGAMGVLNLIVSSFRVCPLYCLTGINTYQSKKEENEEI